MPALLAPHLAAAEPTTGGAVASFPPVVDHAPSPPTTPAEAELLRDDPYAPLLRGARLRQALLGDDDGLLESPYADLLLLESPYAELLLESPYVELLFPDDPYADLIIESPYVDLLYPADPYSVERR